jgi:GT2 family glycosyltransferase
MPWVIGTGKEHELMTFPEVSLAGGGYHTKAVAADCIFISTQTFLELRGMDKRCFHHTFHADLCMRIHLAGGGVYQVNDIRAVRKGAPQTSFRGNVRRAWQAFRGGCHYYRKYKSKNTNIITVGLLYFGLSLRLLGDIIKSIRMALTK